MALNKDKKKEVVGEVSQLLETSKLTVIAKYSGTSVKSMQQLRLQSRDSGTNIRVVKNRLFKKALSENDKFKDIDTEMLSGQLIYAFNDTDEVAPAQNLAAFAKQEPQIEFIGGITASGELLKVEDLKA